MKKIALRTAVVAAVIAPTIALGAGTATAVPNPITGGVSGEVDLRVPPGESWNCFGFDSAFRFSAGVSKLEGFTSGSTVTVFCFGSTSPFFFTGSFKAGT